MLSKARAQPPAAVPAHGRSAVPFTLRGRGILEDTTAALQKATPEDLRRQLKVVFEGPGPPWSEGRAGRDRGR